MKKFISFLFLVAVVFVFFIHPIWGQNGDEEEEEYPKEPIIFVQPVKAVIFEHKTHVEDYGLECDSCHDDIFEMAAGTAEENGDFTMKSLYEGKYCGACHDGETAFASNTRCATCHIGVIGWKRLVGGTENKQH